MISLSLTEAATDIKDLIIVVELISERMCCKLGLFDRLMHFDQNIIIKTAAP